MKKSLDERNGTFLHRHLGPSPSETEEMLRAVGAGSLDNFMADVVPASIRSREPLQLRAFPHAQSEHEALRRLREIARGNKVYRSFIGMGYYRTVTPAVIQRNILENPSWYTHYTPYQPEISQGRLEALLNFQTLIADLTGLPVANASLLDEATAAAEAMALAYGVFEGKRDASAQCTPTFWVSEGCHPQTLAVVRTRAEALGIKVEFGKIDPSTFAPGVFGMLLQYPDTYGRVEDLAGVIAAAHQRGALAVVAADLLALAVLKSPGEFGADVCVGSSQRFGVPMGYGGPHAAFFSVRDEFKRLMPGRLIGISRDASGQPAYRLALQTREQHIRREKATSNICTAQVLLAVMASMYAVYHGPRGLRRIAMDIHEKTARLAAALRAAGIVLGQDNFFDTLVFETPSGVETVLKRAEAKQINLRRFPDGRFGLSLDEPATDQDLADLVEVITGRPLALPPASGTPAWPVALNRATAYLAQPVFNRYHSETEFLRYVKRLERRDLSLADAMIPLGSCTMKLNASSEMLPITWPEFAELHPFAPPSQAQGYARIFSDLESALCDITGFDAVSLQPNAGSQGELTGLLVIRAWQRSRGQDERTICLIPRSAHGTNPASAVMAGFQVIVVECDPQGNIDLDDLRAKAAQYGPRLAALMVTYPSTHGVFEEAVREICEVVHAQGGQVYMDGANLNAQVGLCQPAAIGADVCHINLHKTFSIPHGGGGPGMGPIGVKGHLAPFLPEHPVVPLGHRQGIGSVSAAPWGSASILPISWMYMAMMGGDGLTQASKIAILNANYVAFVLHDIFPVLYRGAKRYVAHECILDVRPAKKSAGIEADDIAKRLMDYGFHAPTVSFPVAGTLMIEPTESESKAELDRFCEAMRAIHGEIQAIGKGQSDPKDNPLKNAPHTAAVVCRSAWDHSYSREQAAFPSEATRQSKFWPSVSRVDNVYGDRNLICTCPSMESYE